MRKPTRIRGIALRITGALLLLAGLGFVGLLLAYRFDNTTRIYTAVTIERPIDMVFEYVTTPANWPKWHPASLAVRGATDHPLEVGEQVTEDFQTAGRRGTVVWTVVARQAPRSWVIAGKVTGSEGEGVITYTLSPHAQGAAFAREFVYGSPTVLFYIINKLTLQNAIMAESEKALRRLKRQLESR